MVFLLSVWLVEAQRARRELREELLARPGQESQGSLGARADPSGSAVVKAEAAWQEVWPGWAAWLGWAA